MQEETNQRFAVVHLEATGTTARAKILELAILILEQDYDEINVVDSLNMLINPLSKVKEEVLAKKEIPLELLESAPAFSQIASDVYQLLENTTVLSSQLDFHLKLLNSEFKKEKLELKNESIDLVKLAQEKITDEKIKSFADACSYYEIPYREESHVVDQTYQSVEVFQNAYADIKTQSEYEISYCALHRAHPGLDLKVLSKLTGHAGLLQLYKAGKPMYVERFKSLRREAPKYLLTFKDRYDQDIDSIQTAHFHDPLIALRMKEERIRRLKPVINYSERRDAWGVFYSENPFTMQSMPLLKGKGTLVHYAPEEEATERWINIQRQDGEYDEYSYVDMEDPELMSQLKKEKDKKIRAKIKPFTEYPHDDFVVMGPGRDDDELSCHFFIKRKLYGHSFLSGQQVYGMEKCPDNVRTIKENDFLKYLILEELESWSRNPSDQHSIKVFQRAKKEAPKGNSKSSKSNSKNQRHKKKSRSNNNRNRRPQS